MQKCILLVHSMACTRARARAPHHASHAPRADVHFWRVSVRGHSRSARARDLEFQHLRAARALRVATALRRASTHPMTEVAFNITIDVVSDTI